MEIGKYNVLKIARFVDFGAYLDGGDNNEILLPKRYVPDTVAVGSEIEVFIYHDNEGRLIATTEHPYGIVGEFRLLKVKDVSKIGAFLDWGIMKDLFVPFREQKTQMKVGEKHLVHIYLDHISKRITASARIDKFLDNIQPSYTRNQEVDLIIADKTELGYKVIINNLHWGLIYNNEIFRNVSKGAQCKGYIKEVREDEKIDVSLTPLGYGKIEDIARKILQTVKQNGGRLNVGDKSEAEEIYALFACSKKSFKSAVGTLYKQHLITIGNKEIELAKMK